MKNLIHRKRLLLLFLLFAMLVHCTGCTLYAEEIQKEEVPQSAEHTETSDKEFAEILESEPELQEEMPRVQKQESSMEEKETEQVKSDQIKEVSKKKESQERIKQENSPKEAEYSVLEKQLEPQPEPPKEPEKQPEQESTKEQQPKVETPPTEEEIPEQVDMEQLGDWYMSNEEYDEMVSNSNVGVGEN